MARPQPGRQSPEKTSPEVLPGDRFFWAPPLPSLNEQSKNPLSFSRSDPVISFSKPTAYPPTVTTTNSYRPHPRPLSHSPAFSVGGSPSSLHGERRPQQDSDQFSLYAKAMESAQASQQTHSKRQVLDLLDYYDQLDQAHRQESTREQAQAHTQKRQQALHATDLHGYRQEGHFSYQTEGLRREFRRYTADPAGWPHTHSCHDTSPPYVPPPHANARREAYGSVPAHLSDLSSERYVGHYSTTQLLQEVGSTIVKITPELMERFLLDMCDIITDYGPGHPEGEPLTEVVTSFATWAKDCDLLLVYTDLRTEVASVLGRTVIQWEGRAATVKSIRRKNTRYYGVRFRLADKGPVYGHSTHNQPLSHRAASHDATANLGKSLSFMSPSPPEPPRPTFRSPRPPVHVRQSRSLSQGSAPRHPPLGAYGRVIQPPQQMPPPPAPSYSLFAQQPDTPTGLFSMQNPKTFYGRGAYSPVSSNRHHVRHQHEAGNQPADGMLDHVLSSSGPWIGGRPVSGKYS